jgi:hypothetical protein
MSSRVLLVSAIHTLCGNLLDISSTFPLVIVQHCVYNVPVNQRTSHERLYSHRLPGLPLLRRSDDWLGKGPGRERTAALQGLRRDVRHHPGPSLGRHAARHGQGRALPLPSDGGLLDPVHGAHLRCPPGHDLQAPPEGRGEVRIPPEPACPQRPGRGRTVRRAVELLRHEGED